MDTNEMLCREARAGAFHLGAGLGVVSMVALVATGALAEEYKIGDVELTVSGNSGHGSQDDAAASMRWRNN